MTNTQKRVIYPLIVTLLLMGAGMTLPAFAGKNFTYKGGVSEEYRVPLAAKAPTLDGHRGVNKLMSKLDSKSRKFAKSLIAELYGD